MFFIFNLTRKTQISSSIKWPACKIAARLTVKNIRGSLFCGVALESSSFFNSILAPFRKYFRTVKLSRYRPYFDTNKKKPNTM